MKRSFRYEIIFAAARRSSCLTCGKNGRDGDAINNPFPYLRLCHQVTIARDITFSQLPYLFFLLSLLRDSIALDSISVATKTIRQKKEVKERRKGPSGRPARARARTNDECAFIGPHLSRAVLMCTSRAVAFAGGGRKKYGVWVDGKKIGRRRTPSPSPSRERISGKIIAKFEYDSPCGYDPVEDIREILQASFVRGLLSLSAIFLSPYYRLFLPYRSFAGRSFSISIPSSLRLVSPRVN